MALEQVSSADASHCDASRALSRSDLILSQITHQDIFHDIGNHPEGDARSRFLAPRAARAHYVEGLVWAQVRVYYGMVEDVKIGNANVDDEEWQERYHQVMLELDRLLEWHIRVFRDDSLAATAPVATRFFMDKIFRYGLELPGKNCLRAPNGELRTFYGSTGDRVPESLMVPRDSDDDLFRRIITERLMYPVNGYIVAPLQNIYNRMVGRNTGSEEAGLSGSTLGILVSVLECVVAVSCLAASVMLLYNIKKTKDRLIAATFLSLAFIIPVFFLSKAAMRVFTLTAANWAVLIVFLSTSNFNLNDDSHSLC